jgi:dihydroorotate dehydrogenase
VKIAPDLDLDQVRVIAGTMKKNGIEGVIATNTTVSRDAVLGQKHANEAGGLSGTPVLEPSNRVIRQLRAELGAGYPIIGVGGVTDGPSARSKIEAGADLVQVYTGLIYRGPELIKEAAGALKRA